MNLLRYLQGERRGMGSQLPKQHHPVLVELSNILLPSILIQTVVRLADVSFWQDLIDFAVMRAAGIQGVIIRAGQRNWEDSKFKVNWAKAKFAGIPRGSYWFYDSREDPKEQAALWASLIENDKGELVHCADLEESYRGAYGQPSHFKTFILEFQRRTGLPDDRIAIYTGHFWWHDRVGNDTFFRRFQLWLAWYGEMSVVRVPLPWTEADLLFWQYTGSGNGALYGVGSHEIDLNYYVADEISFKRRFSLETLPPPIPEEPTVEDKYFKVTTTVLNIRSSAVNLGTVNDIGDLLLGDVVHAIELPSTTDGIIWHQIESGVYRGGRWANFSTPSPTGKYYCAEKGTSVFMVEVPNPAPARTVKHIFKIYTDGSYSVDDGPIIA